MFENKVVLVTGGTGTFGQKFTEVVLNEHRPQKLIIFSRDELKQHEMRQIYPESNDSCIRYFIGDVRDRDRLKRAFVGVDIVVHAAAMKQVTSCEYNPFEAILTNVMGAKNVIDAAIDESVEKVIAISTDKAVNPVNLYGATKLCSEKLFVQSNAYSGEEGTRFSCVRYGNVLGSRGSVLPVFEEQRKNGKITVTDPRMTRFWITLDQGVRFVLKCIGQMYGGEIFVPKIPSMNIMDLVKTVAPECEVDIVGIRPGEKLNEVLISREEATHTVELDEMYIVQPANPSWQIEEIPGTKPLPEDFQYKSNENSRWLTVPELKRILQ